MSLTIAPEELGPGGGIGAGDGTGRIAHGLNVAEQASRRHEAHTMLDSLCASVDRVGKIETLIGTEEERRALSLQGAAKSPGSPRLPARDLDGGCAAEVSPTIHRRTLVLPPRPLDPAQPEAGT